MKTFTAQDLVEAKIPLPIRQVTYHGEVARFPLPVALHSGDALLIVRFAASLLQTPPPHFYHLNDGNRVRAQLPIEQGSVVIDLMPEGPKRTLCIDKQEFELEKCRMFYLHGPVLRIEAIKADNMGQILMAISDGRRPTDGRR